MYIFHYILYYRYEVTARLSYKDTKLFREVIHHDLEFISILLNLGNYIYIIVIIYIITYALCNYFF